MLVFVFNPVKGGVRPFKLGFQRGFVFVWVRADDDFFARQLFGFVNDDPRQFLGVGSQSGNQVAVVRLGRFRRIAPVRTHRR
jgi:hypothetical protein